MPFMAAFDLDFEQCYQAARSRDGRFDGRFVTAVTSTGIYCRPSCPAQTPKRENVRFYATSAAAVAAGFRACRRCRPDASPGSPDWNARADLAARALRLIADGVVDTEGVTGLARRLAVSERHLHRQLTAEVGAGPLALARMRRAQTARLLAERSSLPLTDVAFAAGFASIRQFNETIRAVFGCTPSELRRRAAGPGPEPGGPLVLRLEHREPLDAEALLGWLAARAVPGVEEVEGGAYRRALRLPRSAGWLELRPLAGAGVTQLRLHLDDLRDLGTAVQRCRHLLDLDADPAAVGEVLGADPLLAPLVAARPGLRVPGCTDGFELAARAVLGQRVSVAGARTLAARLVALLGKPLDAPVGTVTHLFPPPEALAGADPADLAGLGLTRGRAAALRALAAAVAAGDLSLDRGADREETARKLLALPGVGPWTAASVAMRALGDPDALPASDLGLRRAMERLGYPGDPRAITARAERWRPWRAYGAAHLWASTPATPTARRPR